MRRVAVADPGHRILTALTIVLAVACSGGPAHGPHLAGLEAELPRWMEAAGIPGLSIAVIGDGEIAWSSALGQLGRKSPVAVDERTVFPAASLSKPVFAYIVLRLVERGALDLDRPLAELVSYSRVEHDPRHARITARSVLTHHSGLPNWGGTPLELVRDPGTAFGYSGEGFVYLQRSVEKLTGESLAELARREVFEPLGMTDSSFVWRDDFAGRAVSGVDWLDREQPPERHETPNAAYSLQTTALDYARFVIALMDGRGLDAATLEAMLGRQVDAARPGRDDPPDTIHWGLGWGLQRGPREDVFWHWGDNGSFMAYVAARRRARDGVVYFANSNSGLSIAEAVLSRLWREPQPALVWAGYDAFDSPRTRARQSLQQAFRDGGVDAGVASYHELRRRSPDALDERVANNAGYYLLANDRIDEAIALFALNVEAYPRSFNTYDSLAEAYLEAGDLERSLDNYERAVALRPDHAHGQRRAAWIRETLETLAAPRRLPQARLARCVGRFGARRVTLDEGVLHYQREGHPRYPLVPIADDTFVADGLYGYRVRCVGADTGPARALLLIGVDGDQDESPRNPDD